MQISFIYNCKCAIYVALMQCNFYKIVFNCAVWCFCFGDNGARHTRKPVSQSAWIICKLWGSPAALHPWVNQFGNSSSLLSELAWTWTWRQNERTRFYQQIKTAEKKNQKKAELHTGNRKFHPYCCILCAWVCVSVQACVYVCVCWDVILVNNVSETTSPLGLQHLKGRDSSDRWVWPAVMRSRSALWTVLIDVQAEEVQLPAWAKTITKYAKP